MSKSQAAPNRVGGKNPWFSSKSFLFGFPGGHDSYLFLIGTSFKCNADPFCFAICYWTKLHSFHIKFLLSIFWENLFWSETTWIFWLTGWKYIWLWSLQCLVIDLATFTMPSIEAVHGIKLRGERPDEHELETQKKTKYQVKIIFEYIIYFNLYSNVNTAKDWWQGA